MAKVVGPETQKWHREQQADTKVGGCAGASRTVKIRRWLQAIRRRLQGPPKEKHI